MIISSFQTIALTTKQTMLQGIYTACMKNTVTSEGVGNVFPRSSALLRDWDWK